MTECLRVVVGTTRFELATTRPPDVYSTGLSYVPKLEIPFKKGWVILDSNQ